MKLRNGSRLFNAHFCGNYFSKFFFPGVVLVWILLYAFAKSPTPTKKLRGNEDSMSTKLKNTNARKFGGYFDDPTHAIIVVGHSVMKLSKMRNADVDEDSWWLLSYQKGQGFPMIIASHIKKGVELAMAVRLLMLVFYRTLKNIFTICL